MSATFEDLNVVVSQKMKSTAGKAVLDLEDLITQLRASGATEQVVRQALLNDLESVGRIFGAFRNGVKNNIKDAILSAGNISANKAYEQAGIQEFKWVTVSTKPCPDCEDRHGEVADMEFFETIGLPKSGFSVCGTHCQCQLVPSAYKGKGLDAPLIRNVGRK